MMVGRVSVGVGIGARTLTALIHWLCAAGGSARILFWMVLTIAGTVMTCGYALQSQKGTVLVRKQECEGSRVRIKVFESITMCRWVLYEQSGRTV